MKKSNLADFVIKILGIATLIYAVPYLRPVLDALSQRKLDFFQDPVQNKAIFVQSLVNSMTIFVILLLIGVALVIWSKPLSKKLLCNSEGDVKTSVIPFQVVGFSIVGLYLFTTSISGIISPISHYFLLQNAGDSFPAEAVGFKRWSWMIACTVQAIIGFLLFLGSRGLSSLWFLFQKSRPLSSINMRK